MGTILDECDPVPVTDFSNSQNVLRKSKVMSGKNRFRLRSYSSLEIPNIGGTIGLYRVKIHVGAVCKKRIYSSPAYIGRNQNPAAGFDIQQIQTVVNRVSSPEKAVPRSW